jgi:endoglucanase
VTLNNAQPYDGSKYAGVSFFAKVGKKSTKAVRFNLADAQTVDQGGLCTQCWNHFGKDLTLTPEWKKYTVSFGELIQQDGWGDPRPPNIDATRLWQLVWHVTEKGADFDVWVDQVQFLACKEQ